MDAATEGCSSPSNFRAHFQRPSVCLFGFVVVASFPQGAAQVVEARSHVFMVLTQQFLAHRKRYSVLLFCLFIGRLVPEQNGYAVEALRQVFMLFTQQFAPRCQGCVEQRLCFVGLSFTC